MPPRFTLKTAADVEVPGTPADLVDLEQRCSAVLDDTSDGELDAERLHLLYLELLGFQARAKWDGEIAEANLKLACGEHSGLDGLVTWNRERRTNLALDTARVKKEHPQIWAQFVVEVPNRSFAVVPMRSYAPSVPI